MNFKQLTVLAGGATLLLSAAASADFQGLSSEVVMIDGVDGAPAHWTARIYANLGAGDRLDAVYGNAANPLSMGTTSSLYQNAFGGNTSTAINPALYAAFPSLVYDSWVTIGLEDQGNNALSDIGMNYGADSVSTSDGSFYVTPDDAQGAEVGGRVLIAQFTSMDYDSHLVGTISLQGKLADGSNWGAESVSYDFALPAPGALALLGLAGIAGRRRRRA
jgi:MYXO-CTERM domain-containing protein